MTPENRSRIYILALVVLLLGLAAAVIFGVTDLDTAQNIALWIMGVIGLPATATAVANRPTKPQP